MLILRKDPGYIVFIIRGCRAKRGMGNYSGRLELFSPLFTGIASLKGLVSSFFCKSIIVYHNISL
jgi:hypothetical protein